MKLKDQYKIKNKMEERINHTKEEILEIKAEMLSGTINNFIEKDDIVCPELIEEYILLKRSIEEKQRAYYDKVSIPRIIFRKSSKLYRDLNNIVRKTFNIVGSFRKNILRLKIFNRDFNMNKGNVNKQFGNPRE